MTNLANDKNTKNDVTTDKLYYTDSYATAFSARVLAIEEVDGRSAVILNQTLFYPTSGGQPNDTGVLAGQAVVDVVARGEAVLHLLDGAPLARPGDSIEGAITWSRRYDHMQQHSGQHLLSQVFARNFENETVSVHFGATESTLDLDTNAVTPEQIAAVERLANEHAYQALPIKSYFVNDQEVAGLPLRRPPKVSGLIRIVEIDGYDYSACGGTHLHTTAEIAPIKIVRQERRRGQTRISFLCGLRACADYAEKHRLLVETANLFSTEAGAVPGLVQRMLEQTKDLQRQVDSLTERLIGLEIAELAAGAERIDVLHVVSQIYPDRSVDALKQTASLLREREDMIALLATTVDGKLTLVFTRSQDIGIHAGNLLRDTLKAFGGGGGGRPDFAQGGGVDATAAEAVLEYAKKLIEAQSTSG